MKVPLSKLEVIEDIIEKQDVKKINRKVRVKKLKGETKNVRIRRSLPRGKRVRSMERE